MYVALFGRSPIQSTPEQCDIHTRQQGHDQYMQPHHHRFNHTPLQSQYILSLALFVVKNMEIFTPNSDIHTNNTRSKSNLFLPLTRLTKCQKGVYFAGIQIFNYLPENIKTLITQINLKVNLRNSFYWAPLILLKNSMDGHPTEIFMLHIFNQHFPITLYVFYYKVLTPSIVSFGCGDIIHIQTY